MADRVKQLLINIATQQLNIMVQKFEWATISDNIAPQNAMLHGYIVQQLELNIEMFQKKTSR